MATNNKNIQQQLDMSDNNIIEALINSNNLKLERLEISPGLIPEDCDWQKLGISIGKNTNIEELRFNLIEEGEGETIRFSLFHGYGAPGYVARIAKADLRSLITGISSNRSIQKLVFTDCVIDKGYLFQKFVPFFKNSNLKTLHVDGYHLDQNCLNILADSLKEFNSLEEFQMYDSESDIQDAYEEVIKALEFHPRLHTLILFRIGLDSKGYSALAVLLKQCSIRKLEIQSCEIDGKSSSILANNLTGGMSSLKELNFLGVSLESPKGWDDIMSAFMSPAVCSVEKLSLRYCSFSDEAASIIAQAVSKVSSLKTLDATRLGIASTGWIALFQCLQSDQCCLEELELNENAIGDEANEQLTNILVNNRKLNKLSMKGFRHTRRTCEIFTNVLHSHHSRLVEIHLEGNAVREAILIQLANALNGNDTLKVLGVTPHRSRLTHDGWESISELICNKSSIMNTYQANHMIETLFIDNLDDWENIPDDILWALKINKNKKISKTQRAHLKVIKTHFKDSFMVEPFISLKVAAIPRALAWMSKDLHIINFPSKCKALEKIYEFVKNTPLLFEYHNLNGSSEDKVL